MDMASLQGSAQVVFDWSRGEEVLRDALLAYERRTHIYQEVHQDNGDAPQHKYAPKGMKRGSLRHRQWLFFAALTDRRQLSEEVYKNHVHLHREFPWLYEKRFLAEWPRYKKECALAEPPRTSKLFTELVLESAATSDRQMVDFITLLLESRRIGVPRQSARYWVPCMRTLYEAFDGDPLRMYKKGSIEAILGWCGDVERATRRDPLPGYGPKLLSLLALFYEELGLLPSVDGAFPVDVHIQRLFISTGAVVGSGTIESDALAEKLRRPLYALCSKNGWSPLRASHALWFNGNRNCSGCSSRKDIEHRCPIYSLCGGAIESRSYFRQGKWHLDVPRLPKGRPNHSLL